jgi:hypothetical protein
MNTQPHERKKPTDHTADGQKHAITQGGEAAGLEWRAGGDTWISAYDAAVRGLAQAQPLRASDSVGEGGAHGLAAGVFAAEFFDQLRNGQSRIGRSELAEQINRRLLPAPLSGELPQIARVLDPRLFGEFCALCRVKGWIEVA